MFFEGKVEMRLSHSKYREAQVVFRKLKRRRATTLCLATAIVAWVIGIALFFGQPQWDFLGLVIVALPVATALLMLMTWHEWRKSAKTVAGLMSEGKVLAIDWSSRRHFDGYLQRVGASGSDDMLFELQEEVNRGRRQWDDGLDEKLKGLRNEET
jgi:cell division protein FtsL